jgi:hypothetical protein
MSPFRCRSGRQPDREYVEAKMKILAKSAGSHFRLEIAVSGCDDPQIHLAPLERPYRSEFPLLDESQQFDLHFQREVADLVEERGPAIG